MRLINTVLTAAVAALATLAAACGGHTATATEQHAAEAAPAQAVAKVSDPVAGLYAASVGGDGQVTVAFNLDSCRRMCAEWHMPCRVGGEPYAVEAVGGRVTQMVASNLGNAINPVLVMLTAQGRVAMLNIADALASGDVRCSGPLSGFADVRSLKAVSDESGTGVIAEDHNGRETMVEEFDAPGYYYIDDFEIHLGRDWKMRFRNSDGIDMGGSFSSTSVERGNAFTHKVVATIGGKAYRFHLTRRSDTGRCTVTLHTGDDLPLISGRPLPCSVEYTSRYTD